MRFLSYGVVFHYNVCFLHAWDYSKIGLGFCQWVKKTSLLFHARRRVKKITDNSFASLANVKFKNNAVC